MSQRFSDAELAAEYWAAYSEHVRNSAQIIYEKGAMDNPHVQSSFSAGIERATTLHRFATLPHAHEEPGAYAFQCKECDMRLETDNQHQCEVFARNHQYLDHDYYKDKP